MYLEKLLSRLDEQLLIKVQAYIEFLLWQRDKADSGASNETRIVTVAGELDQYKGDAPFPNIHVSEHEYYEQ